MCGAGRMRAGVLFVCVGSSGKKLAVCRFQGELGKSRTLTQTHSHTFFRAIYFHQWLSDPLCSVRPGKECPQLH